ncbi:MAG: hypothetical protein WAN16_06550, partial [Chthoniobacterales bacterium]
MKRALGFSEWSSSGPDSSQYTSKFMMGPFGWGDQDLVMFLMVKEEGKALPVRRVFNRRFRRGAQMGGRGFGICEN